MCELVSLIETGDLALAVYVVVVFMIVQLIENVVVPVVVKTLVFEEK